MTDINEIASQVAQILESVREVWWKRPENIWSLVLGIAGTLFSLGALLQASRAQKAASEAREIFRLQTLSERIAAINARLARIDSRTNYEDARQVVLECSTEIVKGLEPCRKRPSLSDSISAIEQLLTAISGALEAVRPTNSDQEVVGPVFVALDKLIRDLLTALAQLQGKFAVESEGLKGNRNGTK